MVTRLRRNIAFIFSTFNTVIFLDQCSYHKLTVNWQSTNWQSTVFTVIGKLVISWLTLSCIMVKNSQTYLKNGHTYYKTLVVSYGKCGHFSTLCMKVFKTKQVSRFFLWLVFSLICSRPAPFHFTWLWQHQECKSIWIICRNHNTGEKTGEKFIFNLQNKLLNLEHFERSVLYLAVTYLLHFAAPWKVCHHQVLLKRNNSSRNARYREAKFMFSSKNLRVLLSSQKFDTQTIYV